MSSLAFLISMGFVIYFLVKGDKQDQIDRKEFLEKESKMKGNKK
jgi:hypothetical protein